jgi:amidophosphoribosyltransferase
MESKKDACGVCGIYLNDPERQVSFHIYWCLLSLQHRGHESAGMTVFDDNGLKTYKDIGFVKDIFDSKSSSFIKERIRRHEPHSKILVEDIKGHIGIGHVRYATQGPDVYENVQPLLTKSNGFELSIGFNGTISNYSQLLGKCNNLYHYHLKTSCDTEIIGEFLSEGLKRNNFEKISELDGAYSVVALTDDKRIISFRDPFGLRPLSYGFDGEFFVVASESCVLNKLMNKNHVHDVQPGEMIIYNGHELKKQMLPCEKKAHKHCMFEWVYFSRPDSKIEEIVVLQARKKLGMVLAESYETDADIVTPLPDGGRYAAKGFSEESGIPYEEVIVRDRFFPQRSFIKKGQKNREHIAKEKISFIDDLIAGKKIVLVDDSIVRGTTTKNIVKRLREKGAKEVHLRISCPPIIAPCFFGIDFPTFEELFVHRLGVTPENYDLETINERAQEHTGADSLYYNSIENLKQALGLPDLCTSCLNGVYPYDYLPYQVLEAVLNT